jgi:hypothetical protein
MATCELTGSVSQAGRHNELNAPLPSHQVGFFKVIVMPLIRTWVQAFPECDSILARVSCSLDGLNL